MLWKMVVTDQSRSVHSCKIMNKRQIIFMILSLLMMIGIFAFSSFEGDDSEEMSMAAGELVCKIFIPHYEDLSEAKKLVLAERIDYPIRKSAHMAEYGLLASLVFFAVLPDFKVQNRKYYLLTFLISVLYAISDECHQLMIPGRSGRATDVLIDSIGMLIGILICYLIVKRVSSSRSCDIHRE